MSKGIDRQQEKCRDVIVVGGGAAGLMAAIQAARCGAQVLVLEHMERPGKKLLMTGNGKCNFTNEALFDLDEQQDKNLAETYLQKYYHGACPAFVLPALRAFGAEDTLDFFGELGVHGVARRGGYYPAGGQAAGVLSVLLMECERLGIEIRCEIGIRRIVKAEKNFVFDTKTDNYISKKCILATGGKSYKKTGSDGSGFRYVECFGHHTQDLVPALVPLQSNLAFFKKVAGIRAEISTKIYIDHSEMTCESGELQLTDYGISGICIFQMSYLAARALQDGKDVCVELDFLPGFSDGVALTYMQLRAGGVHSAQKSMAQCMIGLFPEKLGAALLEEAGIPPEEPCRLLTEAKARRLVSCIKHFQVPIDGTRSFEQAQVTAGGVDTAEVHAKTMESKLVPGLYFAGEMLDVDGICGGFNLQWAWSSGAVAGMEAARSIKK